MSRNELTFSLGDGEDGEFMLTEPAPAPEAPASGFAEVIVTPEQEVLQRVLDEVESNPEPVEVRKRARRFHADVPFVLGLLLFLLALLASASFFVSFSGLYAAAAWAVGINPPLQIAVPLFVDISIIAFSLALFIERERNEKVLGTWIAITVFAAASATANILHTLEVSTAINIGQLVVGAVISGGAPIVLAVASDKIGVKVFQNPKNKSTT